MIGKVLGNRYRVLREVGSGGMAQVYLAEDKNDKSLVAVKVLYPQFGEDLSYVQRFKREAKLANNLTDPHIVRVLDYGADRDLYYLIMEYIVGRDLHDILDEEGPFTWRDALETLDQLATALEHAHDHGVVHRDIKPQNLMIDESGLLKVLDFGIARVDALPSLTQSGFVGSPYYVSPEQAMGETVDIRSDIYSSGIVLYELLSGSIPFDAKSPWSVISKHISSEPPPIDFSEEDVPAEVQTLLSRMIGKRPEDRFQTPSELRQAIGAVLAGQPIPEGNWPTDDPADTSKRATMAESFYQRGVQAIQAEEWGRATGLFSQVIKLDPNHPEAHEQLVLSERETALLSDYHIAKQAMKNGFWVDALNRFERIMTMEPDYRDVKELHAQAKQAYSREKPINDQAENQVETRYQEGRMLIETAEWKRAITILQEVQKLAPGYKDTNELLTKARHASQVGQIKPQPRSGGGRIWLWGLGAVMLIVLIAGGIFFFNQNPSVAGESTVQLDLRGLYQQAQQALETGNQDQAVALLQQILAEDPNYADVASLLRELTATPTIPPPPPPTTEATDPLALKLQEAEAALNLAQWSQAITILQEIRDEDEMYQTASVSALFCDAYVNRGLESLNSIELGNDNQLDMVTTAQQDFEAGIQECPRRTDLRDQLNRAQTYAQALNTPVDDYDTLIETLRPIVAAEPMYANGQAKNLLYDAHLQRGQQQTELIQALSDYDAALALNVADPTEALALRSELLIQGQQQTTASQPTSTTVAESLIITPQKTPEITATEVQTTAILTPTPTVALRNPPQLLTPNDTRFVGKLTEVYLEWEDVALAEDEYYDLTITHRFGDELRYWGAATRESQVKIPPEVGAGEAGNDRFDWWVTIRQEDTASAEGDLDRAVSDQSEVRWFVWEVPR